DAHELDVVVLAAVIGSDEAGVAPLVGVVFDREVDLARGAEAGDVGAGEVAGVVVADGDAPVRKAAVYGNRARRGWAAKGERREAARDSAAHVVLRDPVWRIVRCC